MGEAPSDVFHFIPYVVNAKISATESFEVGNYKFGNSSKIPYNLFKKKKDQFMNNLEFMAVVWNIPF